MILNKSSSFSVKLTWILYEMCELGELADWFFGLLVLFVFLKDTIFTLWCGCKDYIKTIKYIIQYLIHRRYSVNGSYYHLKSMYS